MPNSPEPPSALRTFAIAGLAVLAPALGGSTELRAQSGLLLGIAALCIFAPPRRSAGLLWNLILPLIMTLALTAFLPARWFRLPEWRRVLVANYQVELPPTLSPQPWLSAEAACLMFAGLVFAYYLITQAWDPKSRRQAARLYCSGIAVLAVASLVSLATGWKIPFWPKVLNSAVDFGFFPNRNQTANVLALGGIISTALAFESFERKRAGGLYWTAALGLMGTALLFASSRAGLVLLLGGVIVWVIASFVLSRSGKGAALGSAAVAALLTLFLVIGGETFERFQQLAKDAPADFRLYLHEDAARFSATAPWLGQGIGNFGQVFAMARRVSVAQNRAIHPESDWLWMAVDTGWPATLLLLGAFLLWLNQCYPFSSGTDRPVRSAAVVCGVAFALHAGFDVAGHRPGSALPALLLAALALRPNRHLTPARWVAPLFRGFGLLLAGIACWWIATIYVEEAGEIAPTSHTLAGILDQIDHERARGYYPSVRDLADKALRITPLDSDLYYQRGIARVVEAFSVYGAARDFKIARFLEPNWSNLCLSEGKIWAAVDQPELAFDAWTEALRRAGSEAPALYNHMLWTSSSKIALHSALQQLARRHVGYLVIFLKYADRIEAENEIARLLESDPELKTLSGEQRRELFAVWFERGDQALLLSNLSARPDWQKNGWPWLAKSLAADKQYERAYRLVKENGKPPALPLITPGNSLDDLKRAFWLRPGDIVQGLALYSAHRKVGQLKEALDILRELRSKPGGPAYLSYLESELLAEQGQWEAAWEAWTRFAGPNPLQGEGWSSL